MTRTNRLAREIRIGLSRRRASAGRKVAPEGEIESLQGWLERLWERTLPQATLLSESAELLLWRDIIQDERASAATRVVPELFDLAGLAESAAEAWRRVCEWGDPPASAREATTETRAFARWQASFLRRCREGGWRSRAELTGLVAEALEHGELQAPETIAFVGFRASTPALDRLLAALCEAGAQAAGEAQPGLLWSDVEGVGGRLDYVRYACMGDEVRAVAAAIRQEVESHPQVSIGVVAGDLAAYRDTLERVFVEEFDPEALLEPAKARERNFDLAGAPALDQYPMIANAFDLLALRACNNPFELLSRILLSPYPLALRAEPGEATDAAAGPDPAQGSGAADADAACAADADAACAAASPPHATELAERDRCERARLEAKLREDNRALVDLGGGVGLIGIALRTEAASFATRLRKLQRLLEGPARRSPKSWGDNFVARLRAIGWPSTGTEALRESERVVFGRWREAVAELASLDAVRAQMSENEALAWLREICSRRLVQPPSPGLQVQAMGLLDAAGLAFDRLYVLGLDASALPAAARPHPLLPAGWQRALRMPFSSAELELELARRSWRELCTSAPEIHVSYALQGSAGEELLPSPLVADAFETIEGLQTSPKPWYLPDPAERTSRVEPRPAEGATPPASVFRGGTALIQNQARCPFRAMARHRLSVEPFGELESEPTAATRGALVHRCLKEIWDELETGARLKALDEAALESLCERCANQAVDEHPKRTPLPPGLRDQLVAWLTGAARDWLAYETKREGDWEVIVREGPETLDLQAGEGRTLKLEHLKIDRVDRLPGGEVLVLDYKTGATRRTCSAWRGERPDEPQLPLYVLARLARGDDVRAAAFAHLGSPDALGFSGPPELAPFVSADEKPSKPRGWTNWEEELDQIKANLEALAAAYMEGKSAVDPKKRSKSCVWCGLQPLCRIHEVGAGDEEEGDSRAGRERGVQA